METHSEHHIAGEPCAGCHLHGAAEPSPDSSERLIARRAFVVRSALALAATALAACMGSGSDVTAPSTVQSLTLKLSDYPALANVGGIALVTDGGTPIAVVRTGTSSFVALSRICPHQGGTVSPDSSGGFTCPIHGARFSDTGAWIGGQPTSNLTSYGATYDAAAGTVTVA